MRWQLTLFLALAAPPGLTAQEAPSRGDYLRWVSGEAKRLRAAGSPLVNATSGQGEARKALIRRMDAALGIGPLEMVPLDPVTVGRIEKPEYVIEKIHFQTMPGVRMPANLYLPRKAGKLPAVLHVHGHWAGAKQDPAVQARCVSCARAGMVALAVDAFGAGERAIGQALGEYHGGMTAATLLPVGRPLAGIQIIENARAVDYLLSRPEVDGERIGVTGASGGGNQTMYAGAHDSRLKAVVPVCSVGNYQAYLGAACCMCEVVPGALQFTEEDAVLACVAPRALKVISASRDSRQFSPVEAAKSIVSARRLYEALGKGGSLDHHVFESGHDYSKGMREAMVGFMWKHLAGQGNGEPVPDAEFKPEPRETLRCFEAGSRPASWATLPQFAGDQGRKTLHAMKWPTHAAGWTQWRKESGPTLEKLLHGEGSVPQGRGLLQGLGKGSRQVVVETEPGISLPVFVELGEIGKPLILLVHEDGLEAARKTPLAEALRKRGAGLVTMDLRATGSLSIQGERIGLAPDHNSAEWALWLGRPLAGQWAHDLRVTARAIARELSGRRPVVVVGMGPMGVAALLAGAQDDQFAGVAMVDSMTSWISDKPYDKQRLATIIPHVIPRLGDIPQVAALVGNRHLVIAGGTDCQGRNLAPAEVVQAFNAARGAFDTGPQFLPLDPETIAGALAGK